jgi:hypothetical protein
MTGRSLFRVLRWVGLAAVAPVLWACQARSLERPELKPEMTYGKNFQQTINRNVDMLFLVDDSSSMRLTQDNLNRNFPTFMTRLMDPPGLPNIHVAVISSDMGAGDGSVASCNSTGGKQGIFQYTARGACTSTGLEAGATYISDIAGTRNYTGNLPDVFTCIAALGESGCGFEHQFASMLRALGADGQPAPQENQGFLRPDAYLVIIMITNEDDCSATPGVPLFDTGSNTNITSQLGPPANFRCNEFGHLCDDGAGMTGIHPNRNAPNADVAATVMYPSCRSNDQEGYLLSVLDTANRIKALKADPSQVLVAAITGPVTPYTVNWKAPSTADTSCGAASCPWPVIAHSCTASDGSFADPSVRVTEFVNQFGANGITLPICLDSFSMSLDRIAMLINASLQPPCINSPVARKPGGTEYDCTVVSHTSNGLGGTVDATVPACSENGGQAPCWQLTPGGMGCTGNIVDVSTDPSLPQSTAQNATVNCALCDPNFPDPNRMCN